MASRWDHRTDAPHADTTTLICMPSAGNGDLQFDRWPDAVGPWCVVRTPTVGDPGGEAVGTDSATPTGLPERAAELVTYLMRRGIERFALFGHESAALLGYQVAVELNRRGAPAPLRLFVSGCPAPHHLRRHTGDAHTEPTDDELTERVLATTVAMGGNPMPWVVATGVRALRAELAMLRAYRTPRRTPLRCPLTAIRWLDQDIAPEALAGWAAYGDTELVQLPGTRLSYATEPADLLRVISDRATADDRRRSAEG
ncbi:thioesterase II family protein [Micromonospora sp. HUAS LYJ1]|uniref:thioesterase II family protein n=1 Tax=Micromonospora sp. HUAS LYJ1 TaxID=3061626 RepID=UPI002673D348|nr:thioesterase domain-containing protein [Micromonospora sp. HUAS LYJ1]WKU02963.1 thioesterase domain-containing protein [Micromonospora sp. HUAS LYJ1]